MRRAIVVLIALVAVGGLVFALFRSSPPSIGEISEGSPKLFDSTLRSLRGKPVVVNFWATWCEPCKSEMPRIVAAAEKYEGRVHFLGVDVEDDVKTAAAFARRYEMTFRSLSDPDGTIRRDQKLLGLPVTQFYSADGDLSFLQNGEITAKDLDRKIRDVLAIDGERG